MNIELHSHRRRALLKAALVLALPVRAADLAHRSNRFAATIQPAERFEAGGLLVERHGAASGRALVLIPGLASGSWAWQDLIRAFAPDHPVYVLTLPGFDGRPPAGANPFAAARADVAKLIAARHLDQPVLVGHSLGGTLALAVAEDQPRSVGGVVSIDGLPVMPGAEDIPAFERQRLAGGMGAAAAPTPLERFAADQQNYMRTIGVLDMDKGDELAKLTANSDPASVARYSADLLALDLRPGLKGITAPVLVLMPFFDLDAEQQGLTQAAKLDYYRALMEGTPRLQVAPVAPARHFAMLDQPQAVIGAVRGFLGAL